MNRAARAALLITTGIAFLLWLLVDALFVVYPWQSALIVQFGRVLSAKHDPGLYIKAPFAQEVRYFDSRVLTIDTADPDRYITAEKENLLVNSYVKWRIIDPKKYVESVNSEGAAVSRLLEIVNRGLRDEIGKRTVKDVVTGEREEVMSIMRARANEGAKSFGVEIIDVRLKRVDLPEGVSENVYKNMIEERRRIANERRSSGEAEKEKIRAEADRERTVILAEARRKADILRGEGNAESASIYSRAFSSHPDFYDFYRSLLSYQRTLGTERDFFLLSPSSDFFRFLKDERGGVLTDGIPSLIKPQSKK